MSKQFEAEQRLKKALSEAFESHPPAESQCPTCGSASKTRRNLIDCGPGIRTCPDKWHGHKEFWGVADSSPKQPIQPTYYLRHPDETYTAADPQPVAAYLVNAKDVIIEEQAFEIGRLSPKQPASAREWPSWIGHKLSCDCIECKPDGEFSVPILNAKQAFNNPIMRQAFELVTSHVTASLRKDNEALTQMLRKDVAELEAEKERAEAAERDNADLRAFNESLHNLCRKVWEALEPTGEYEGDMKLVEFAKSVRIAKDSAEWSLGRIPELEAKVEAADRERDKETERANYNAEAAGANLLALKSAEAELAKLWKALQIHGKHLQSCAKYKDRVYGETAYPSPDIKCDCGLGAALQPQVELPAKGEKNG